MSDKLFTQADMDRAIYQVRDGEFASFLVAASLAVMVSETSGMGLAGFVELLDVYVRERTQVLDNIQASL